MSWADRKLAKEMAWQMKKANKFGFLILNQESGVMEGKWALTSAHTKPLKKTAFFTLLDTLQKLLEI